MTKSTLILGLLLALLPLAASAEDYVCLDTNHGEICVRLYPEFAPGTVANFLRYVDSGRYNGTLIHRSTVAAAEGISVIQGGGYGGLPANFFSQVSTDAPIAMENRVSNRRGTIAMARLGGDLNSATSQWFINVVDNIALDVSDGGYAAFGTVVLGLEVAEHINGLRRGDFSQALQSSAFAQVPITLPPDQTSADFEHFVVVNRAYRTPVLPYQCSAASPSDTLTEYCDSEVRFPVSVNGALYDGTLRLLPQRTHLEFAVDTTKLRPLADGGQPRATFTDGSGQLVIPSVRVGATVYENVRLQLIDQQRLELRVVDFIVR